MAPIFIQKNQSRMFSNVTITVTAQTGGTVSGGGIYKKRDIITLTAKNNIGYDFTGWYSGGILLSSSSTYRFEATSDINIEARFVAVNYTVTVTSQTGGTVSGGGIYGKGTTVTVTASPNPEYKFSGWYNPSGTIVTTANPYSFIITDNISLQGRFSANLYNKVGYFGTGGGTLSYVAGVRPSKVRVDITMAEYSGSGTFTGTETRRFYLYHSIGSGTNWGQVTVTFNDTSVTVKSPFGSSSNAAPVTVTLMY